MAYDGRNNLIPMNQRSEEEASELGRKGGIASGEARRKKAVMLSVLDKTLDKENNKGLTYMEMMTLGLIQGAIKGNPKNYELVFNLMDQKDRQETVEKRIVCIPAKDIPRSFVDIYRDIINRKYYEYWLEGGRGSDKSSMWSEIVAELLENNQKMCALLIRKVGNTLKDSVYSQMQWGIDK